MHSHLDSIQNWEKLAIKSKYRSAALARLAGCSPRELQRYTKQHFNQTPQEWLDYLLFKDAIRRLLTGSQVKAVATDLHFKDCSHFCRKFKQHFGLSPMAFVSDQKKRRVARIPEMSRIGH